MGTLPTGTVTFLFTDIEGSTRLWEQQPLVMQDALAQHNALIHDKVTANGGMVVKHTGDGIMASGTQCRRRRVRLDGGADRRKVTVRCHQVTGWDHPGS